MVSLEVIKEIKVGDVIEGVMCTNNLCKVTHITEDVSGTNEYDEPTTGIVLTVQASDGAVHSIFLHDMLRKLVRHKSRSASMCR